ncbi:MAG: glutathione S-transferase [Bordetella sp. SCN 67-23]|uniref:Glutathione S-transferase n=1 Tax=Pigmentiphaga kullae TaxID=151784 RepID=A0A4Q7NMG0_9BURK|nr:MULTISPECIES: glutathione S-transferase C-terminal domain-containing protein [Pigmentiphaga]MBN9472715.1 glutathione S-transferase N-terminal domain-containing protein [Burkholderiales bacterium]ODS72299.1 MAG: glutathione S-transferase [Bordetella sp. SCN 67-23]ODU77942.1 MAG: glutathione S-transferase [Bordetella sp. SCN 68-11]OJW88924.1 MAG: glutathione S-transferase [Burkholderiales bacterium 67-32]AZG07570.1 glutathione S-transferase [Pigmentiphaga sp. H8]
MKLIGSLASPFVRKVRIVLADKKLDYQFEQENVWAADTRIQDSNPLGKVPCLIMEDGGAVFDSRVIVEYLDTITPVCRLLPPSGRERSEVKCWEALADGLLDAAVLIRAEYTQRPEALRSESWIARQQGKIDAAVEAMETGLGEKPFCAGNSYTLADVAVGCALGYLDFRYPERDWRDGHPNLARLAEKLAQRPSFADTDPRQG